MRERIDDPLRPGVAFDWVRDFAGQPHHDIVMFSRNSALTALRAIKTLAQHDVIPRRFVFTNGKDPVAYLHAYVVPVIVNPYTINQPEFIYVDRYFRVLNRT